jgi:hypothetical protein
VSSTPRLGSVVSTIAAFALIVSACSGSGGDADPEASADTVAPAQQDSTDSTPVADDEAGDPTTPADPPAAPSESTPEQPVLSTEPLFGDFDQSIELLTSFEGGGIRPTLEWTEVAGVDHYGVYLYAPSGAVYWAWRGRTTSIVVGGEPRLADAAAGPSVSNGMTWAVVAYDADLLPLAVSPAAPIAP